MTNAGERRASNYQRVSVNSKRHGIYVNDQEGFNKRSGIYVDSDREGRSTRSAVYIEDNMADERTPLISKEDVISQIVAQTSRLDASTNNLLAQAENLSNAAEVFKPVPKKKTCFEKLFRCCVSSDDE